MPQVEENTEKDQGKVRVIGYVLLKTERIPAMKDYEAIQKEFFDDFFAWVPENDRFEERFKNIKVDGRETNEKVVIIYIKKPWKNTTFTQLFHIALKSLEIQTTEAREQREEVSRRLEDLWTHSEAQLENLQVIWNLKGDK